MNMDGKRWTWMRKTDEIAPIVWGSSVQIPTMEDDIREDEEWCYQCRYICCDTIFRQKWKFDRHIASWWAVTGLIQRKWNSCPSISVMECWSVSSMNKTSKLNSLKVLSSNRCWVILCIDHCLEYLKNCGILKYSNTYLIYSKIAVYSELPRVTTFGRLTTVAGCR